MLAADYSLAQGTGHRAQDTGHEQRGFVLEGLMKDWVRCVGVGVGVGVGAR